MDHLPKSSNANKTSRLLHALLLAWGILFLPACRLPCLQSPDPAPALPDSFNGSCSSDNTAQIGWYEFFNDPTLNGLIDQSLSGNQELKILTQEVQIANYEIMARRGSYFPFVSFGAGAGIDKASKFTRNGAVDEQLQPIPGKNFPKPLPDFLLASNVSWEIDIWRKLRNARDAAALRYFATQEGQNYIVTRLIAEVSENYYELLALDNRLQALDKTIEFQEQSLEMAKAKKEAGRGTELAVQRFIAEVRKNQSEKLIINQEIVQTENKINFLLGRYPQHVERSPEGFLDLSLHALSVGVPAQLLQNRADIRQAERELSAAGLDVQVARARFYPSLTLSAGVGYEAFNTNYLFVSPESLIYNAVGEVTAPLLNKAAIKADYLSANAMQLQKVYNYQRTILTAYTEVINRIAKVQNYAASIEFKKQQLAALEASVDNAIKLFQSARAEYMDVLLSQRDLMEAKMALIETKKQQLGAMVNAYQALGGGGVPGQLPLRQRMQDYYQPTPQPPQPQPEAFPPGPEALPPGSKVPQPMAATARPFRNGPCSWSRFSFSRSSTCSMGRANQIAAGAGAVS